MSEEKKMEEVDIELLSNYYEDTLPTAKAEEVAVLIESDARYKKAYANLEKSMKALSRMHKMTAPHNFDKNVEESIRRRSGGRFFGKRAFGNRIPYEIIAVFLLLLALFVYWLGRNSGTGGHKLQEDETSPVHREAREALPER